MILRFRRLHSLIFPSENYPGQYTGRCHKTAGKIGGSHYDPARPPPFPIQTIPGMPGQRSPYLIPGESEIKKCHAAISAGKKSPSRSTARTAAGNFCDEHRLPPNHACAGLAEWKKTPAPGVGIRYGGGGVSTYGGGYAATPKGKKPGQYRCGSARISGSLSWRLCSSSLLSCLFSVEGESSPGKIPRLPPGTRVYFIFT